MSQSWMTCTNPGNNNIVSVFKIKVTWFVYFILNKVYSYPESSEISAKESLFKVL